MSTITKFEEIEAWKLARELAKEIYALTREDAFARDQGLIYFYSKKFIGRSEITFVCSIRCRVCQ